MPIDIDTFPMPSFVSLLNSAGFDTLEEVTNGGSISVRHDATCQGDLVVSKRSDRHLSVAHTNS